MHPSNETDQRLERVFTLVEGGLTEPCTVENMAEEACYSLFHFIRTFTRATLYSPYEYLIRRRVAAAMDRVLGQGLRITDAAFEYCFESVEGFSRAVKRCCGRAPSQLTPEIQEFLPSPWTIQRLEVYRWVTQGPTGQRLTTPGDGMTLDPIRWQFRAISYEFLGQQGFGCRLTPSTTNILVSQMFDSVQVDRTEQDGVSHPASSQLPILKQLQTQAQLAVQEMVEK